MTFHILQTESSDVVRLTKLLINVREKLRLFENCGSVTEHRACSICCDSRRLPASIRLVEEATDVVAFERTREFCVPDHVFVGADQPLEGIGPDGLRIAKASGRLHDAGATEVIFATDRNLEGEAAAIYLSRLPVQLGLTVSRLAIGRPWAEISSTPTG
jgi:recombination protein RecR